jgi:pimeloyl-ACP methyl ester carboxylesterase
MGTGAPPERLHYTRAGEGPPLLLVHGLGGTGAIWRPVAERLAAERDVIAVDMPGFGRSTPLADGTAPTAANLAAAVIGFCEDLGVSRPHVAGNSLGAWVGLEMARAGAASSVGGLSPAGLWRKPLGPRKRERWNQGQRLRPLVSALLRTRRGRALLLRTTVADPERVPAADAAAWVNGYLDSPAYPAANREMRSSAFEHPEEIKVPVTIAWGKLDRLLRAPRPERMPPQTRYLELPGCGHTPTWDDPELVTKVLLEASARDREYGRAQASESRVGQGRREGE